MWILLLLILWSNLHHYILQLLPDIFQNAKHSFEYVLYTLKLYSLSCNELISIAHVLIQLTNTIYYIWLCTVHDIHKTFQHSRSPIVSHFYLYSLKVQSSRILKSWRYWNPNTITCQVPFLFNETVTKPNIVDVEQIISQL